MKFFVIALALAFTACSSTPSPTPVTPVTPAASPTPSPSIACNLEQSLAGAMATGVASTLGCSGTNQIQADILAAAGKANLCTAVAASKATLKATRQPEKGVLGNVVCPLLIDQVSAIALAKVPTAWGCAGGTTVDQVKTQLTTLCQNNVSF